MAGSFGWKTPRDSICTTRKRSVDLYSPFGLELESEERAGRKRVSGRKGEQISTHSQARKRKKKRKQKKNKKEKTDDFSRCIACWLISKPCIVWCFFFLVLSDISVIS